jgi:hypothetical protein
MMQVSIGQMGQEPLQAENFHFGIRQESDR